MTGRFLILLFGLAMVAQAQTGNPAHDALAAKPPAEQRATLTRLIQSEAQVACNDVTSFFSAGLDGQRTAFWDVRCREGLLLRVALPSARWGRPSMLVCGAAGATPPAGGPCFRPAAEGLAAPVVQAGTPQENQCRASCTANQPSGLAAACTQRCVLGGGVEFGRQVAETLPPGTRFGVIFASDTPLAAFGFANGQTDRLAVNLDAARACQSMAGRTPCLFRGELINQCSALVQGVARHPQAIAMTSDLSTQVLARWDVGRGGTAEAASAEALGTCRAGVGPGVTCRVVASGC